MQELNGPSSIRPECCARISESVPATNPLQCHTTRHRLGISFKSHALRAAAKILAFIIYNIYVCFVIIRSWKYQNQLQSTHILVFFTLLIYVCIVYVYCLRDYVFKPLAKKWRRTHRENRRNYTAYRTAQKLIWVIIFSSIGVLLYFDTKHNRIRLISLFGIFAVLIFGYVFSHNRKEVKWRPVLWGVLIQYLLAVFAIRWSHGRGAIRIAEEKILTFLNYTEAGSSYVYGFLVTGQVGSQENELYVMCYKTLTAIIFISMWLSVLYHLGIMQKAIIKLGWLLEHTLGTTACESMAAAANIALNMPEACLTIQPYLQYMTMSELHAVMTAGFSTIAGNMFVAYVRLGAQATHLLSASLMSAPAALAISKLLYPETQKSRTHHWNIIFHKCECGTVLEAAVTGAINGMALMLKVASNLIGFVTLISICNYLPGWFGGLVGFPFISLKWIFGKLLLPVAYLIGVEDADAPAVAWLIGVNACFTNMASYKILSDMKREKLLSPRSEIVATYAICGFCNLSSVGVSLGTLGNLAPDRKADFAGLLGRTLMAGTCACIMTACVAGSLIVEPSWEFVLSNRTSHEIPGFWS